MAHGLGYGDNFQSVLMSNGNGEMLKFKVTNGTSNDSAYLMYLLVLRFSRNRTFGNMIGGYQSAMKYDGAWFLKAITLLKAPTISIKDTARKNTDYRCRISLYEGKDGKRTFKELTDKFD
jgi:glycerol-3-phosphate dehydrogenase (NAD(P)+)